MRFALVLFLVQFLSTTKSVAETLAPRANLSFGTATQKTLAERTNSSYFILQYALLGGLISQDCPTELTDEARRRSAAARLFLRDVANYSVEDFQSLESKTASYYAALKNTLSIPEICGMKNAIFGYEVDWDVLQDL